jgi:hypothetical protein
MYVPQLTNFYDQILNDVRINARHISLYMALFEFWNKNKFNNPIQIKRDMIMPFAKINGIATYHQCMKDLHQLGYIVYHPSFHPGIPSEVYFTE